MRTMDKVLLWVFYRLSSRKERIRHRNDLTLQLKQQQQLTEVLELKLAAILSAPLSERSRQPDYIQSNTTQMRHLLKELKANTSRLRERIEIIQPTFPKAHIHRSG
jgi:septal ring factor EnvC (AmiA/AmiB activator)